MHNGLPMFYADIDDESGINIMSLVDYPAVESNFVCFAENEKAIKLATDEERHILTGVAMVPNLPIYRRDAEFGEYYITFTRDVIERIAIKFFREHCTTSINLDHDVMVDSCTIFESYLINHKRGIVPAEFSDYPDGTWIISTKVDDPELWSAIREGRYNGYSVEGFVKYATAQPTTMSALIRKALKSR